VDHVQRRAWVITIRDSINNSQLKVATELGGRLDSDGTVSILGIEDNADVS
jgi:hypothetical protein